MTTSNSPGRSAKRTRRNRTTHKLRPETIAALVVVAILVFAMGCMLVATDGLMNRGYGVAFFICSALIAGIAFWTLSPGARQGNAFNLRVLGIRLGGGAAIGASFALLAWTVVPSDSTFVVQRLNGEGDVTITELGDGARDAAYVAARKWLVVEMEPGADTASVSVRWFDEALEPPTVRKTVLVKRHKGTANEEN
jgi:hypothetical protein